MATAEQRIQDALKTYPIIKDFYASTDDVRECRNVFQMDAEGAARNFTISQLATSQCFAAPPLTLTSVRRRTAVTIHYLGPGMAGHHGIAHGGVLATVLDECCGKAATTHFEALHYESETSNGSVFNPREGVLAVTAQLSLSFQQAAYVDSVIVTHATIDTEKSSPRKAIVNAQVWQADGNVPPQHTIVATGSGLFIRPRNVKQQ